MGVLCELEEKHGVDLGRGYKNDMACSSFVDYIGDEQWQFLVNGKLS